MTAVIIAEILIFVAMAVGSLYAGMRISDYYNDRMQEEIKLALQKQYARLTAGVDADDSAQPYVYSPPKQTSPFKPKVNAKIQQSKPKFSLPPDFMTRLKQNGSASMVVNKPPACR